MSYISMSPGKEVRSHNDCIAKKSIFITHQKSTKTTTYNIEKQKRSEKDLQGSYRWATAHTEVHDRHL